ncbi:MAG: aspartate--tRNA(Asn) ligase [Candidatus Freyarchaeota archaeon]|nr:aspartate--tRNA(Asn) ligase [Candidatus Jordarchaeia archaeon]
MVVALPCSPPKLRRTHYSKDIKPELDGKEVVVCGWVERVRDLGGLVFVILRDMEGRVQVTFPKRSGGLYEKAKELGKEYVVAVRGTVKFMENAPGGAEIIPEELVILNVAASPLPLDPSGKTDANLDTRLDNRVLDLRRPKVNAIFRLRHNVLRFIRSFLIDEGFTEVQTPKIIASATEGGAELFPISYYEREAFLSQSAQLYKEQLSSVFEKVFEIGPCYRAEESRTVRHLSEVYVVDVEVAFADAEDVMNLLERLIYYVLRKVADECRRELSVLGRKLEVQEPPFPRYTYTEILGVLEERGIPIAWGEDISTPAYRELGEAIKGFYFITEWPTKGKPFYIKPRENRPEVCEAFDLMYEWIELASGGTRIHEKELLIKRLKEQGLAPSSFDFHLKTFDWGMPPHAGWGLGLDRLIMVITGVENIRECVFYPRDRDRLTP